MRPLVTLMKSMDTQQLADLYFRFYPLFQQAYEDLGYPGQYFNDRLVEAIDSSAGGARSAGPSSWCSRGCSTSSRTRSSKRARPGRN